MSTNGENFMETLNCKGMICPQPVVETKDFLATHPHVMELLVLVDNLAAAQNVERFLGTKGFQTLIQGADPDFQVRAQRQVERSCETVGKDI
jgi:TusA-related sulfurtransferase